MFVPLAALVIVGSSNAVNLADGLDGLAGGCLVCATGGVGGGGLRQRVMPSGPLTWALPHMSGAGEMLVVAAAMIGGVLGFLVVQLPPGLGLHGRHRVAAAGRVAGTAGRDRAAGVAAGRDRRRVCRRSGQRDRASRLVSLARKRVFRCARCTITFNCTGWPEDKIVVRFWIAAALCAIAGLAALKSPTGSSNDMRFAATAGQLR